MIASSSEMAVEATRLSYQLPFPFRPKPYAFPPRLRQESVRKFQEKSYSISSSLVDEQQQQSLSFTEKESALVEALLGIQGRGRAASAQQLKDVEDAIQSLEDVKGVPDPTSSDLVEGRWQLIFTTRPGTASPIQRTFVGVDFFKVFQEVNLRTDDQRVSNIVKFSDAIGELKVEAAATLKDGKRILFQFDRAAFSFKFLPFKVPYPVPFKLLGDEAKGWLDTTYLSESGNLRISRGNKGTTFVLQKELEPRQRLLEAIASGSGIMEVIDELVSLMKKDNKGCNETLQGEWQLLWVSQSVDQSWESIAADGFRGLQIVKENGQLENMVDVFPGLRYIASGDLLKKSESSTFSVKMNNGAAQIGAIKLPLEIESSYTMQLLYLDKKIRITRRDQGIVSVHLRLNRTRKS